MTNKNRNAGWKVWTVWLLIYTIPYILLRSNLTATVADTYFEATTGMSANVDIGFNARLVGIYLVIAIGIGLITGLIQWAILRPYGLSPWWIIVTAIGFLSSFEGEVFIVWAALQSIILWQSVHYAGIWFVANSVTLYINDNVSSRLYLYWSTYQHEYGHLADPPCSFLIVLLEPDVFLAMDFIAGVLGGIITASVLVWLLRHPKARITNSQ